MTAIDQDLGPIYQGESYDFTVAVTLDGSPRDLSAATVTWRLALTSTSATLLTKTPASLSNVSGTNDGANFELSSTETGLSPASYYHETRITTGSTDTKVYAAGRLPIRASITHPIST